MKTRKLFHALLAVSLFGSATSQAQVLTQKRNVELGGDVTFSSQSESGDDESLTTFSVNPYIGVFLTDNFELGFRPGLSTQSYGDESLSMINFFVAPAYNFNIGSTVYPYVEFLIGYNSIDLFDETATGLGTGIDGGLKVGVGSNGLFLVKLEYLHQNYSVDGDDFSINTFSMGLGFRVFFAPKVVGK